MVAYITSPRFLGGAAAALGTLTTYAAGSNTPKLTYTDKTKVTQNATAVPLDARGEADIYLDGSYKLVLKNAAGSTLWTRDNIDDFSQLAQEFINQVDAAYFSPSAIRIAGNVTAVFSPGRRIKIQDAVVVYGEITTSTYSAGYTTVKFLADNHATLTAAVTSAYISIVSTNAYLRPTEWINDVLATYVNATDFTVEGDATGLFTVGRRVKLTDATTLYGTVTSSAVTTGVTTVVVSLDNDASLTSSLTSAAVSFVGNNSVPTNTIPGDGMIAVPLAVIFKKTQRWFYEFFPSGTDLGDGVNNARSALQAALNYTALNREKLIIPTPSNFYKINNGVGDNSSGIDVPEHTYVEQAEGAWIRPDFNSHGGTQFGNILGDVTDVVWVNAQVDCIDIDITATTGGPYGTGYVGDNIFGFSGRPVSGDLLPKTQGIRFEGGHLKNVFSQEKRSHGPGGNANNFEQCAMACIVDGMRYTNCTRALIASPDLNSAIRANGYAFNYRFTNIFAEKCGSVLHYLVNDTVLGDLPTGDPSVQSCYLEARTYNCGHHPDRKNANVQMMNPHVKHGIIMASGAGNLIFKLTAFNAPGFPSVAQPCGGTEWPTGYPPAGGEYLVDNYTGGGLQGPIGAPFMGWGRNIKGDIDFTGDADALYNPAPPNSAWGNVGFARRQFPTGAFNNDLTIRHVGTVKSAIKTAPAMFVTTVVSATTTTVTVDASVKPELDDEFVGLYIWAIEGTNRGSKVEILGYDAASGVFTINTLDPGDVFDNTTVIMIGAVTVYGGDGSYNNVSSHTSTVITFPSGVLTAISNMYIGDKFVVRDGNGAGQIVTISDSNTTSITLAIALSPNPDNDTFNWAIVTDMRAPNANVSGWLDIQAGQITGKPIHESAAIYDNMRVWLRTTHGVNIMGTPAGIFNGYNNSTGDKGSLVVADSLVPRLISGKRYIIANDAVQIIFVTDFPYGKLVITSIATGVSHDVFYCATGTASCEHHAYKSAADNTLFDTATGVLTGTTGADNCFTVSADNANKIYLENRLGSSTAVSVRFEN